MTAQNISRTLAFQVPEMLSSPPRRRTVLGRIIDRFAQLHARRDIFAELYGANDRELSDIGITRADIDRIFEPSFADEYAWRGEWPVRPRKSAGE
jgi:uncharacterized protein YjiS (DUF1127 family)